MPRSLPRSLIVLALFAMLAHPVGAQGGLSSFLAEPTPVPDLKPATNSKAVTSLYRGDAKNIIARTPWADLTEEQFYLYLLCTNAAQADLYETWRKAPVGDGKKKARNKIETAIRRWARDLALSRDSSVQVAGDPAARLQYYRLVYPVHELVWIDRYLAPQVRILPADVQKYYDDHPELAEPPRRARVRFLMLKVGDGKIDAATAADQATEAQWSAAENRMRNILNEIHLGDITFEQAARTYSEASNAAVGGLVDDFSPDTYFAEFEKRAFALQPDEIGAPFRGPQGVYAIEGLAPEPREPLSLTQLRPKIEKRLRVRQIQSRYVYELEQLRKRSRVVIQANRLDVIDPGARAFKVGRIDLTCAELWTAIPDFIGPDFKLQLAPLWHQCNQIAGQELIAQFNTKRGWGEDPRLRWTRDAATQRLRAERRLSDLIRPHLALSPDRVARFVIDKQSDFPELKKTKATLIEVALSKEGRRLGIPHKKHQIQRMRETMESARDAATSVSLAALARAWPENGDNPADLVPLSIERKLLLAADENVTVTRLVADAMNKETNAVHRGILDAALKRIRAGELKDVRFLPVESDDASVRIVYVEQPDYTDLDILEQRWFGLYEKTADIVRRHQAWSIEEGLIDSGKLQILLPETETKVPTP